MKTWSGLALLLAACGGGNSAAVDATLGSQCGAGPYVHYTGTAESRMLDGTTPALADVTARVAECADVQVTSAATGVFQLDITTSSNVTLELSKPSYIPLIIAQFTLAIDFAQMMTLRPASDWATAQRMPGFDSTHGYIVVGVGYIPSTITACNGGDGVTLTLPNHPEATVHYMTADIAMEDTTVTATNSGGGAYISGLAPGDLAAGELVAAKSGCTITLEGETGVIKTAAGTMTRMTLNVHAP